MRILGVAGSLRRNSFNRRLLHGATELLPAGTTLDVWDGLKMMPPFDEDDEGAPGAAVLRLRDAITRADALLIATPQYNGSIPGQLKNALDWASRPYATNVLRGKPVAVIAASPGPSGASRSLAETRAVLACIGADVLEADLAVSHVSSQFDDRGRLRDDAYRIRLTEILERLTHHVRSNRPDQRRPHARDHQAILL